jgi:Protein of unknown function (DUF3754)
LYRKRVSPIAAPAEDEIIKDASPAFLARNMVVKRFTDIPLADLDMVFPDHKAGSYPWIAS